MVMNVIPIFVNDVVYRRGKTILIIQDGFVIIDEARHSKNSLKKYFLIFIKKGVKPFDNYQ